VEIAGAGPPVPGDENAVAEFSIAAPLCRRPEFILFLVVAAAAAALRLHQARLAQLMRLERIRTRIAADLHDDIGAGLSEVSVLAEVVRGRLGARDSEAESQLGQIAQTARHLVDSMGDIVWAIDPRRDDLASLIARLRHFAATLAEAAQIGFVLGTGVGVADVPLAAGRRRDLYLLLKEAVHNALRHAGARRVEMRITVERGVLRGEVLDDGSGFDPSTARNGHGLDSMRERAKALGGKLDVASVSGSGTRITVSVPVGRNPA
jgi:signal transduction histidine kinase